ncbi:MAG: cupin domain-containing protein [Candidatus Limnocylindria bacterium]
MGPALARVEGVGQTVIQERRAMTMAMSTNPGHATSHGLRVRVGFSEHRLGTGDSIGFGDHEPHQLRNDTAAEARAIVLATRDSRGHGPRQA